MPVRLNVHAVPRFQRQVMAMGREVLVIGAAHSDLLRSPHFSPAHIRAALNVAEPTLVGVEANPIWFANGVCFPGTYECQGIAIPWATERHIPVYGIDWQDYDRMVRDVEEGRLASGVSEAAEAVTLAALREEARSELAARGSADISFDEWNKRPPSVGAAHAALMLRRDQHIAHQCCVLLRMYDSARLAVVIGAMHKAELDAMFAREPDIVVRRLEELGEVSESIIRAAWTQRDAFAVLTECLDGAVPYWFPETVVHRWLREVARVTEDAEDDPERVYLEARRLTAAGDMQTAAELLRDVPLGHDSPTRHLLPWQLQAPLGPGKRAALALGRIRQESGSQREARGLYELVLQALRAEEPRHPEEPANETCVDKIAAWGETADLKRHRRCEAFMRALIASTSGRGS